MADDRGRPSGGSGKDGQKSGGFLGSLKDALAAASRDDTASGAASEQKADAAKTLALPGPGGADASPDQRPPRTEAPSAQEAARDAKITTSLAGARERQSDADAPPTTRVFRGSVKPGAETEQRTQLVRGKQDIKRGQFQQDPVVGWLVIVGGKGLGSYRPIFEGNNTVGRSSTQRIPLDFGDDSISSEEQAYIRYDSEERAFLFVPNLAKTNVVSINSKRPASAVELKAMDVITVGRTQLVFVPFCGPEFDWGELAETKGLSQ